MILNSLKKLNERTKNIIGTTIQILIITVIASLVLCLIFLSIGHFAKLSFMTSLGGICFLTFLITGGVLIIVGIILIFCLIIDAIKRDGLKKLLKRILPTFIVSYIILTVIFFIKHGNLDWTDALLFSFMATLPSFLRTEIELLKKEMDQRDLFAISSSDESDSK